MSKLSDIEEFFNLCKEAEALTYKVEYRGGKLRLLDPFDLVQEFESLQDLKAYMSEHGDSMVSPFQRVTNHPEYDKVSVILNTILSTKRSITCHIQSVVYMSEPGDLKCDIYDFSPADDNLADEQAIINGELDTR